MVKHFLEMKAKMNSLNENIEVCSEKSSKCIMCKLIFGKDYCSGKISKKNWAN